jgi:hypothetical protein
MSLALPISGADGVLARKDKVSIFRQRAAS